MSKQVGVHQVADLHIADLMDGSVNINTGWINIMTRADFNAGGAGSGMQVPVPVRPSRRPGRANAG
jgi:hypothetical protein